MSTPLHGLLISAGQTRPVSLEPDDIAGQLSRLIDCNIFDVVHLEDGIDIFLDDEGLLVERPVLNLALTVIAHAFGTPAVLFGTGVILAGDDETGDTLGLTGAQRQKVLDAMRQKPGTEVMSSLCESLAPFPALVQMLRQSA